LAGVLTAPVAGHRPYRRSVGAQRPRTIIRACCRWASQRADHRSTAGAVSRRGDGKAGRAFPPVPTAAEVSSTHGKCSRCRCIRRIRTRTAAGGRTGKTEAWVVLEAGGKPHLCGPEARHHRGRSAAGSREWNGGGPPRLFSPQARRRRIHTGGDGSRFGRRRGGVRGSGEQRRNVSPPMTGTMWTQRQASPARSRWIGRWPALTLGNAAGGLAPPVVEATEPVKRERLFGLRSLPVVAPARRFAVYRGRAGRAAGAGVGRGRGPVGVRWRLLCRGKRRRIPVAGGGRRVHLSTARPSERAGNRGTGMKKLDCVRSGRHPGRK